MRCHRQALSFTPIPGDDRASPSNMDLVLEEDLFSGDEVPRGWRRGQRIGLYEAS